MANHRWITAAKCRKMDPRLFEVENLPAGREVEEAHRLCSGCPVIAECATDALKPANVSLMLRNYFDSGDLPEYDDLVSIADGVVRAGVPCDPRFAGQELPPAPPEQQLLY